MAAPVDDRLRQLMHRAREHYLNRELDEAEPLLQQIVRAHRGFADMLNMLGVIHHDRGRFVQAEELFEEALRVNPRYTDAALNLAVTCNDLGKYQRAREVYARAMAHSQGQPRSLDPFALGKLANMHAEVADAYAGLGLYEEAVREYRRALELGPGFVDIRVRLGATLRDCGDKEAAVVEYQKAKELQPSYLVARIHLGVTLYSLGRVDEARREWEAVLQVEPDNRSCLVYLELLKKSGGRA